MNYATLTQLENGNLEITLLPDGIEEIKDQQEKDKIDDDILFELIESYFGNGYHNLTGQVGLTDSPIIGYDWDLQDDGSYKEYPSGSKTWWFPNYMVESPLETLLKEGKVIFLAA
jgi:hypothetical protein